MKTTRRKIMSLAAAGLAIGFAGLQFIQPDLPEAAHPSRPIAPPAVEAILKKSCYDCHSNQTDLKWFDKIAPASWLVASHVKQGRQAVNFSQWDQLAPGDQKGTLFRSLNDILTGEMPLPSYLSLHPEAKVTAQDLTVLKQYVLKLSARQPNSSAAQPLAHPSTLPGVSHRRVKPAPNGVEYISDFSTWRAISTTDRFDNGTMRVIYGNAIAVKAIAASQINPWPDGTVFAKVAWKADKDAAGLIRPGDFVQVEFMIKDQQKYKETKGWGWARWKGPDLKPYGKNRLFTSECTSCHRPMKDNDFVFTLPLHLTTK